VLGANGESLGSFDIVVVSAPGPQCARLLEPDAELSELVGRVEMQPCWAVMVAFDRPLPAPFDGAFVHNSSLSWVARNSSKPGRSSSQDCWVLHGSATWSQEHVEATAEEVGEALLDEFWNTKSRFAIRGNSVN
jgi:predicted NAD/FAD-dependent oxidoreductase